MNPVRNPFAPGAGTRPPELSGRVGLLEETSVAIGRAKLRRPAKSMIVVGLRGVGKTVLLNEFDHMARDAGCRTILIEAHEIKPLPDLLVPPLRHLLLELDRLGTLSEAVKRGLRVLKSFMGSVRLKYGEAEIALEIDPEVGAADSGDLEIDLPAVFQAVGQAAIDRGQTVVLLIDELQYLKQREMSALIMALHRINQDRLPILMFGAGLPQVLALAGKSKSYAERLFDFPRVGSLSGADAADAIRKPIEAEGERITAAALAALIAQTQGYPFYLQEWGYQAWQVARQSPIDVADIEAATVVSIRRLDESFFRVRFDRLTPREKDYVRAMASLPGSGPYRSGDVADALGLPVRTVGPVRNNLIAKGMIYAPAYGDTAFTVPLFELFLRRIMPPD
ncbi:MULTISPECIES: ATP-binding protein [Acidiphilium]|uniref:AAA ATPase domain-containing protein n=1 Tax=Acidiphilium rubrum TaxID=526 RepID=A0A8G2CM75_ACIRU|nr:MULTISPECIES: ATP-binding protein [Acidiphilium]SIR18022.1 AAA ATPase domain-containing protein [Acidiphilium rubrum]